MPDRCVVEFDAEPGDFDPDTGQHDPPGGWTERSQPPEAVDGTGVPCRIHEVPLNEDRHVIADQDLHVSRYYCRLPLEAVVKRNDRIRVVEVDERRSDPNHLGRAWIVLDRVSRAFATEQRVTVRVEGVDLR